MDEKIRELLYRSLDEPLDGADRRRLEEALAAAPELRAERHRLLAIRNVLAESASLSFGAGFAERAMTRIRTLNEIESGHEIFFHSLYRLFRPIAFAAATAALAIMTLNMLERGEVSLAAAFALPEEEIGTILKTPLETILEESP